MSLAFAGRQPTHRELHPLATAIGQGVKVNLDSYSSVATAGAHLLLFSAPAPEPTEGATQAERRVFGYSHVPGQSTPGSSREWVATMSQLWSANGRNCYRDAEHV